MSFKPKKMRLVLLFALLSIGVASAELKGAVGGNSHSPSVTEFSHLLDRTHPTGINLKAVDNQMNQERNDKHLSNSLCTKIINIGSNKDKILKIAEGLVLLSVNSPAKASEKKNILNRLKQGPLKGGNKKDETSSEITSQMVMIGGLIMINQKLEAEVSRTLGLTLDQIRKIPPSSSFVGGASGMSRSKSESDLPMLDKKRKAHTWQRGEIPTVQKTQPENHGQGSGLKSFPSSPQLNRQ